MKIYVYCDQTTQDTFCYPYEEPRCSYDLIQTIESKETDLPVTTDWQGQGIQIGEVFICNGITSNLIRVS